MPTDLSLGGCRRGIPKHRVESSSRPRREPRHEIDAAHTEHLRDREELPETDSCNVTPHVEPTHGLDPDARIGCKLDQGETARHPNPPNRRHNMTPWSCRRQEMTP